MRCAGQPVKKARGRWASVGKDIQRVLLRGIGPESKLADDMASDWLMEVITEPSSHCPFSLPGNAVRGFSGILFANLQPSLPPRLKPLNIQSAVRFSVTSGIAHSLARYQHVILRPNEATSTNPECNVIIGGVSLGEKSAGCWYVESCASCSWFDAQ